MDGQTLANELRRIAYQVRQNQNPTASALNAYGNELEGIATRVAASGSDGAPPEQQQATGSAGGGGS